MKAIQIGSRWIGPGHPCFIIAEAGVNHNADPDLARKMVDVAVSAGADAIKFQTFKADRLVALPLGSTDAACASQREMLRRLELSEEAHRQIWEHCRRKNILFLSAPFDEASSDFLEDLGVSAFKIASGELTNLPFLMHVAGKGKPIILSTGMATLEEVRAAVSAIRSAGDVPLTLLHCVSHYPARPDEANLRVLRLLDKTFHVPVGFSDHTLGVEVALAAVALGAAAVEKHFTLDSSLPGPDQALSIEPTRLAELVCCVRNVEAALGHGRKEPTPAELEVARAARKSLVAARLIRAGAHLTADCIAAKRPGIGLPPSMIRDILGRRINRNVEPDTILTLEMFE